MTAPHRPDASPCSENSPLGLMMRKNGKVLFWGTGLAPNTFLHYLEDAANAAYLAVEILSIKYPELRQKLIEFRKKMTEESLENGGRGVEL